MNMEIMKKRQRASNFDRSEVHLLMELVTKYKHIVENKKTDAVTNKEKDAAWLKIAAVFNAASNSTSERSAKTLKLKYESLKKITKKKTAQQRQELYRTGGGPSTAPTLDVIEEKVLAVCTNIAGLDARNDSDCIIEKIESVQQSDQVVGTDIPTEILIIDSHDKVVEDEFNEPSTSNTAEKQTIKEYVVANENIDEIGKDDDKWASWNPTALRTKPSKCLKPRPNTGKHQSTKASVTAHIDELTDARLQLVNLQKDIALREHDFVRKEHILKIEYMRNEEERKKEIHHAIMKNLKNNE